MDDLPWSETSLVGIGPRQVEVELVEGSFGQEVDPVGEGFQIEELIFNEAVNGFDVALVGVGGGRDAIVLRAKVSDGGREVGAGSIGLELAMNSLPLSVCQVRSLKLTPQRRRWV